MSNTVPAFVARLTLSVILLLGPGFTLSFAQRVTTTQDRRQLEKIEKRLENIEEALKRIDSTSTVNPPAPQPSSSATRPAGPFRLPSSFTKRSISFDAAGTPLPAPPVDRDRDDLSDVEEVTLGTDPDNRDTDADALWDGWEVHHINGIDLQAMGASPLHKDIFVEMDYMRRDTATNGLGPSDAVLRGIEAVFAAAPVTNPDGLTGINIHLIRGNEVQHDADLHPYIEEFTRIKRNHFDQNRAPAFHYMIWADGYRRGSSSGVSMDIPHSDFIVTLGKWNGGAGGTDTQKIGTFIHELGHNLGRMHGGSEHQNRKPNHLSVMNYLFQMRGIPRNGMRVFDYQPFTLPALNEANLVESDGLGKAPALVGYSTIFFSGSGEIDVACHDSIDWNGQGSIDTVVVSADLNGDEELKKLLETPNEWAALDFYGGVIGERFPISGILDRVFYEELPFIELTEEQDRKLGPN
jgi:hypothetical protein